MTKLSLQQVLAVQLKSHPNIEPWSDLVHRFFNADQGHVFDYVQELSADQLFELYTDLASIDLTLLQQEQIKDIFAGKNTLADRKIQPFPKDKVCNVEQSKLKKKDWETYGLDLLSKNKVGILLLAGGQGTRLGTTKPKGMYNVGLLSGKSLYQLQAERLLKTIHVVQQYTKQKVCNPNQNPDSFSIPWFIMSSEATRQETQDFFEKHDFFGLRSSDVFIFEQDVLPCFTTEGKIIMKSKSSIAKAPNGNGGLYSALISNNIINVFRQRGIEIVMQYCVDNILVKMADPMFVGYFSEMSANCAAKVCKKSRPEEAVGVLGLVNGKPDVVEYSELDKELSLARDEKGELLFNEAHLCMNAFTVDFLEKIGTDFNSQLPFHIAKKKIPTITSTGEKGEVNGIKLELFIFDSFPFAETMVCYEIEREREFAPLKNACGNDSPETCKLALSNLHKKLITEAGGYISDLTAGDLIEIDPLLGEEGKFLAPIVQDITINKSIEIKKDRKFLLRSLGSSEDENHDP